MADVMQAARRVYLRAVHACPGAAELWRDGFASLGESGPADQADRKHAVQAGVHSGDIDPHAALTCF